MVRAKERSGNLDIWAESRKATITDLKFLLVVYEHTIAINLFVKECGGYSIF